MSEPLEPVVPDCAAGAQRLAPVRLDFLEALTRRAALHEGEVRRLLDGKLAKALIESEGRRAANGMAARPESPPHGGPLADLLRHIARQSSGSHSGIPSAGPSADALGDGARPAELRALSQFRSTWSKLSVDRQLSGSLNRVPENVGPLNSHHLAMRSLTSMRDMSPEYLSRFMSFVDALLWLDQAAGGGPAVQAGATSADDGRPRKPRRRRPA